MIRFIDEHKDRCSDGLCSGIEPVCSVLRIAPWAAITDYVIQRSVGAKPWLTIRDGVSTVRSNIGNPLTNGIPYWLRVAAKNAVGVGR